MTSEQVAGSKTKNKGSLVKIKCPYCSKENKVSLPKDKQILNIHRDNRVLKTVNNDEIGVQCSNKKCGKFIVLRLIQGNIIGKYKHPVETSLNFLSRNSDRIKIENKSNTIIIALRWLLHYKYFITFLLGFISFTIIPNGIFYLFNYPEMIGEHWDITYGIVGGFVLSYSYFLIQKIKKTVGSLELNTEEKDIKHLTFGLSILTDWKQLIIVFFIVYFVNVLDNNFIFEMWVWDFGGFGKNLITAVGILIVISFIIILSNLQRIKLKGDYFDLKKKINSLIDVANHIFIFVVIALFGKFLSQWVLASVLAKTIATSLIVYAVGLPIVGMVIVFSANTFHIHKLMSKIKKEEINRINEEYKNLRKNIFKEKDQNNSEKLSLMVFEKENVDKIKEWPIDAKIIIQTIVGIIIVLTPLILRQLNIF